MSESENGHYISNMPSIEPWINSNRNDVPRSSKFEKDWGIVPFKLFLFSMRVSIPVNCPSSCEKRARREVNG